jgi:predicted small secreted protein
MKKLAIGLVLLASLSLASCKCAAERKAVEDVEATNKIVVGQYLKYVEADANLSADQKDDRRKLIDSLWTLINSLKEALK